ncbi:TPA: polysaccharide pyruvyl transferase family protein [Candidatus Bathyarchaeota archaeon]|nr:polysaccharide pyruvyl transferase family protein [Candidatus Bathyarchaeota archaeon]
MTYVLISRAKKNIGDFLILEKAKRLLERFRPEHKLITLKGWEPLDEHLDEINASSAMIFCGGPNINKTFYPDVYPLTEKVEDIKAPMYLLGGGWNEIPGTPYQKTSYTFTPKARHILSKCVAISCRDNQTVDVLRNNGLKATMTGCPVWYNLDHINEKFKTPATIKKVVFTAPPFDTMPRLYDEQCIETINLLADSFAGAKIYCSFHRGLRADEFTAPEEELRVGAVQDAATKRGMEIVDASYDVSKIDFYEECDLHVGYRLHGHIDFLSMRKPSILLNIDARGKGFGDTVGLPGVQAWSTGPLAEATYTVGNWIGKYNLLNKWTRIVSARSYLRWAQGLWMSGNPDAVKNLRKIIEDEKASGFSSYIGLEQTFLRHFEVMKDFIARLP